MTAEPARVGTLPDSNRLVVPCSATVKRYIVLAAILASSLAFIDGTVVTVGLTSIRLALGASLAETQWFVNAYALMLAAFLLLGGAAGDVYGLRRIFMLGIGLFGIASLGCGLAWSAKSLIAFRSMQGIGAAMQVPGSLALISAFFPPDERGKAIGTWAAASGIAAALGPMLGGAMLDHLTWRAIFIINLPIAMAALLVTWTHVPEARLTPDRGMDWLGGCLAVSWLAALSYGLTALGEPDYERLPALSAIAFGCIGLVAFLTHESTSASPMMPVALFSSRIFSGVNGLTLMLYFALTGALFFLPTVLIEAHGYSATLAGSVFLPFTLVLALVSRVAGGLAERFGLGLPLTLGPVLTGLSFALLIPATAHGSFWFAVSPVMVLMGIGMGITVTPLSTAVMNAVSTDRAGVASAVNNSISRVASLIAVASLGIAATAGFEKALAAATASDQVIAVLRAFGLGALAQAQRSVDPTLRSELVELGSAAILHGFAYVAMISAAFALLGALVAFITISPTGRKK